MIIRAELTYYGFANLNYPRYLQIDHFMHNIASSVRLISDYKSSSTDVRAKYNKHAKWK